MLEFVLPLLPLAFDMTDPGSAQDLASFFSDALDWGMASIQGYLGYCAVIGLAVYFFKS
jgi:hypothetical protein